jgi:hypothetical protein
MNWFGTLVRCTKTYFSQVGHHQRSCMHACRFFSSFEQPIVKGVKERRSDRAIKLHACETIVFGNPHHHRSLLR